MHQTFDVARGQLARGLDDWVGNERIWEKMRKMGKRKNSPSNPFLDSATTGSDAGYGFPVYQ